MGFEPGLLDGRCRQNHRAMAAAPFFNFFGVPFSVTRLLYYYFNIWPFRTMKFAQKFEIFAKVGSQFCQILNSYSRKGPKLPNIMSKWRNFAKSGHTGQSQRGGPFGYLCKLFELADSGLFFVYFRSFQK